MTKGQTEEQGHSQNVLHELHQCMLKQRLKASSVGLHAHSLHLNAHTVLKWMNNKE